MHDGGFATVVKQELGLIEVTFVAGDQVELGECHLCNLMAGHDTGLTGCGTNFTADAVCIADGNVEELT